jgi:RNA polymerase sigma factor (sigma-70 family)
LLTNPFKTNFITLIMVPINTVQNDATLQVAKSPEYYNEPELVQLLAGGKNKAYVYLYQHYSSALFGVILNIVPDETIAADILQDVFINIYRKIDTYDASKSRLYTWMLNIARNLSIDTLRSKGYKNNKLNKEVNDTTVANLFVTYQKTEHIGIKKLLVEIKPKYSKLIELNYYRGYTNNEIAQMMGIPLNTVKTRMKAALLQLRALM